MLNALEHECSSTATSRAPGTSNTLGARYPSKVSSEYARSLTSSSPCARANSTQRARNAVSHTAPVGLLG
jgi:hypothetical protein